MERKGQTGGKETETKVEWGEEGRNEVSKVKERERELRVKGEGGRKEGDSEFQIYCLCWLLLFFTLFQGKGRGILRKRLKGEKTWEGKVWWGKEGGKERLEWEKEGRGGGV